MLSKDIPQYENISNIVQPFFQIETDVMRMIENDDDDGIYEYNVSNYIDDELCLDERLDILLHPSVNAVSNRIGVNQRNRGKTMGTYKKEFLRLNEDELKEEYDIEKFFVQYRKIMKMNYMQVGMMKEKDNSITKYRIYITEGNKLKRDKASFNKGLFAELDD